MIKGTSTSAEHYSWTENSTITQSCVTVPSSVSVSNWLLLVVCFTVHLQPKTITKAGRDVLGEWHEGRADLLPSSFHLHSTPSGIFLCFGRILEFIQKKSHMKQQSPHLHRRITETQQQRLLFKVSIQQAQNCIRVSWLLSAAALSLSPSMCPVSVAETVSHYFLHKDTHSHIHTLTVIRTKLEPR